MNSVDNSEAQIHMYGNVNKSPYKSGNNVHIYKDVGRHGRPGTQPFDDSGAFSNIPDDTHIGIKNPKDFPQISGRNHGE